MGSSIQWCCARTASRSRPGPGRVNEHVRHGLLELVLDVLAGDLLLWAATPHYPLDGHVSFTRKGHYALRSATQQH
jgi:hypothetical protein